MQVFFGQPELCRFELTNHRHSLRCDCPPTQKFQAYTHLFTSAINDRTREISWHLEVKIRVMRAGIKTLIKGKRCCEVKQHEKYSRKMFHIAGHEHMYESYTMFS